MHRNSFPDWLGDINCGAIVCFDAFDQLGGSKFDSIENLLDIWAVRDLGHCPL